MRDRARILVNFALFQIGWFACVLGGASGHALIGPLCGAVILVTHALLTRRGDRVEELLAILLITLAGGMLDAGAVGLGVLTYTGEGLLGVPPWVIGLWSIFASMFDVALRWLQQRPWLAAACAAIGSPASYLAGERLGAVTIGEPRGASLLIVGASWAVFVPLALRARAWLRQRNASRKRRTPSVSQRAGPECT